MKQLIIIGVFALLFTACSDSSDNTPQNDQSISDTQQIADSQNTVDTQSFADAFDPTIYRVAAVQYGRGQAQLVDSECASLEYADACAMKKLAEYAHQQGARLIVFPEYSLEQKNFELQPQIGDLPAEDASLSGSSLIKIYSQIAQELETYIVFNLLTYRGTTTNPEYFNTQVAYDPTGKVVGIHAKFNLFGDEKGSLTAGTDVSVFDTPLGKTGMLICADIYGNSTLLNKLSDTLNAYAVTVSSFWTVDGANQWYKAYAGKYGVYAIVANHTYNSGFGGGVYQPDGFPLVEKLETTPNVVIADIPLP